MKKRLQKKLHKKLHKTNMLLSSKIKFDFSEEEVIRVDKNGEAKLDFTNPKHVETYKKWIKD